MSGEIIQYNGCGVRIRNDYLKDADGKSYHIGDFVIALHREEIPKYLYGQTGTVEKIGMKCIYVRFDNVHYKRGSKFHYGPPEAFRVID